MELTMRRPGLPFWFCRNRLHLGMLLKLLSLSLVFCKRRQLNWMIIVSPSIPKIPLIHGAHFY